MLIEQEALIAPVQMGAACSVQRNVKISAPSVQGDRHPVLRFPAVINAEFSAENRAQQAFIYGFEFVHVRSASRKQNCLCRNHRTTPASLRQGCSRNWGRPFLHFIRGKRRGGLPCPVFRKCPALGSQAGTEPGPCIKSPDGTLLRNFPFAKHRIFAIL